MRAQTDHELFTFYFVDAQIIIANGTDNLSYNDRKLKENMTKLKYLKVGLGGIDRMPLEGGHALGMDKSNFWELFLIEYLIFMKK